MTTGRDEKLKQLDAWLDAYAVALRGKMRQALPSKELWTQEDRMSSSRRVIWRRQLREGSWFEGGHVEVSVEFVSERGHFSDGGRIGLSAVRVSVEGRPWGTIATKTRRIEVQTYGLKPKSRTFDEWSAIVVEHIEKYVPMAIDAVTRTLEDRDSEKRAQSALEREWKGAGFYGHPTHVRDRIEVSLSKDDYDKMIALGTTAIAATKGKRR